MTRCFLLLVALSGCGDTGDGDLLPKRGDRATDPTIVSAGLRCESRTRIRVRVDASDPMGAANLSTCAATIDSSTVQDSFGDGCHLLFSVPCMDGAQIAVAITVGNATGGFTTAMVRLTVPPGSLPPDAPIVLRDAF